MSSQSGFLKLRNGLREHVDAGQFTAVDAGVYLFLHLHKNWRTGICWTNQKGVATTMHTPYTSVKDSFQRLKDRGYIQFRKGDGSRANYAVLLIGDEPTHGVLKGCRLVGFAHNNFDRVVYDFSTGEHPEAVLRASSDRPETARWASSDRLVTVPLPDLQDFKVFKTCPDVSDDQKGQTTSEEGSVGRKNSDASHPRTNLAIKTEEPDQEPSLGYFSQRLGRQLNSEEVHVAEELHLDLLPMDHDLTPDKIVALAEVAIAMQEEYKPKIGVWTDPLLGSGQNYADEYQAPIRKLWDWNKTHRTGTKFEFLSTAQMNQAWFTGKGITKAKFDAHDPVVCKQCQNER